MDALVGEIFSPKRERAATRPTHSLRLDSVGGICREQARLYRLWVNGRIPAEEMTRGVFALGQIRASRESAIAIEAADKAKAPPAPGNVAINILTVPSGYFLSEAQRREDYKWDLNAIKNEQKQLPQAEPSTSAPDPIENGGLQEVFAEPQTQPEPAEAPAQQLDEEPPDNDVQIIAAGLRARRATRIRDEAY
jgi:hypothetical protein